MKYDTYEELYKQNKQMKKLLKSKIFGNSLPEARAIKYYKTLYEQEKEYIKNALEEIDILITTNDISEYQGEKLKNILKGDENGK